MEKLLVSTAVATLLLTVPGMAKAEENKNDWDKPIFIKGADLEGQDLQKN